MNERNSPSLYIYIYTHTDTRVIWPSFRLWTRRVTISVQKNATPLIPKISRTRPWKTGGSWKRLPRSWPTLVTLFFSPPVLASPLVSKRRRIFWQNSFYKFYIRKIETGKEKEWKKNSRHFFFHSRIQGWRRLDKKVGEPLWNEKLQKLRTHDRVSNFDLHLLLERP